MTDKHIHYRSGYKYQLAHDYHDQIPITSPRKIDTQFIALDIEGNLIIKCGYAWDGTSGPVIDTSFNLRASLVHDALYQLMRNNKLPAKVSKDDADQLFRKMCKEDGVLPPIAYIYYCALKLARIRYTDQL